MTLRMRRRLLGAMLCVLTWTGDVRATSQQWSTPDTTRLEPPMGVVPYRSKSESLAALPGRVIYLPVWALIGVTQGAAVVLWDWRLPERTAAALTFADDRVGLRPESSTQIGTGLRAFYRHPLARVEVTSSFGRNAERYHHLLKIAGRAWLLDAGIQREPGESFYGIGMGSSARDRRRFTQARSHLALSTRHRLNAHAQVTASVGYRQVDVSEPAEDGRSLLEIVRPPPGLDDETRLIDLDVTTRFEFVDRPGSPRHGYIARTGIGLHRALDAPLSYVSAHVAGERFFELFERRTLSLRVGGDWRMPLGDDEVPFFDLASIGGNQVVRGFQRGRFRDRGALVSMLVYKVPVWRLLDSMWFYEGGRTFARIDDLTLRGWRRSWGTGLRLYIPSRVLFEQRVAFSDEEWRLLFLARADF